MKTIGEYLPSWEEIITLNFSHHTCYMYKSVASKVFKDCLDKDVLYLNTPEFREFCYRKPSHHIIPIRHFIKFINTLENINILPIPLPKNKLLIKKRRESSRTLFTFEELNALISTSKEISNSTPKKRMLMLYVLYFLFFTGVRKSEFREIDHESVISEGLAYTSVCGKGGLYRTIQLPECLQEFIAENKSILLEIAGEIKSTTLDYLLNRVAKNTVFENRLSPHCFRRSFITTLIENNVPLHHIQHLVGHSSAAVTLGYTRTPSRQVLHKDLKTMTNGIALKKVL